MPLTFVSLLFFILCVLPAYMLCSTGMSVWCPKRPEECIGSHGTGVTDGFEQHLIARN